MPDISLTLKRTVRTSAQLAQNPQLQWTSPDKGLTLREVWGERDMPEGGKKGLEVTVEDLVEQLVSLPIRVLSTYLELLWGMLRGQGGAAALSVYAGREKGDFVSPNLLLLTSTIIWCSFNFDGAEERFRAAPIASIVRAVAGLNEWSTARQFIAKAFVVLVACHLFSMLLANLEFPDDKQAREKSKGPILYQASAMLPLLPPILWLLLQNVNFWSERLPGREIWLLALGLAGCGVAFLILAWLAKDFTATTIEGRERLVGTAAGNGARNLVAMAVLGTLLLNTAMPLIAPLEPDGVVWSACNVDRNGNLVVRGLIRNGGGSTKFVDPSGAKVEILDDHGNLRGISLEHSASLSPSVPTILKPNDEVLVSGTVPATVLQTERADVGSHCRLSNWIIVDARGPMATWVGF